MARPLLMAVLVWTLALLLLGSIVHATGSSLACPDWPTCFGTMMPEMTGGVFWEHLHRLWAGALVMLFAAAVIAIRVATPERRDLLRMGVLGLVALVVQSVLGGLTVIYRLPDALSTSHLALAFAFLALVTAMIARMGVAHGDGASDRAAGGAPGDAGGTPGDAVGAPRDAVGAPGDAVARKAGLWGAAFIFAQSVVGALVRHTDAGMACPDVPLCLGRVIPPLVHPMVQLHFLHRVLGLVVAVVVLRGSWLVLSRATDPAQRRMAAGLAVGVVLQILLGFASVAFRLEPPYVSAHTLLAAILLSLTVAMATRHPRPEPAPAPS